MEANTIPCAHCQGTGMVRSVESTALSILRAIESEGLKGLSAEILVTVPNGVDLYLLNQKRSTLTEIEIHYQLSVTIHRDEALINPDFRIQVLAERKEPLVQPVTVVAREEIIDIEDEEDRPELSSVETTAEEETLSTGEKKRRRNRRRQRKPPHQHPIEAALDATLSQELGVSEAPSEPGIVEETASIGEGTAKSLRRRRRFGKRPRYRSPQQQQEGSGNIAPASQSQQQNPLPLRAEPAQESTGEGKSTRKGWWKRLLES
jgi:ribonuclease E